MSWFPKSFPSRQVVLDEFLKYRKGSEPPTNPPQFHTQRQIIQNCFSVCVEVLAPTSLPTHACMHACFVSSCKFEDILLFEISDCLTLCLAIPSGALIYWDAAINVYIHRYILNICICIYMYIFMYIYICIFRIIFVYKYTHRLVSVQ